MEIIGLKLKNKRNANIFICSTDVGEFELHSDVIVKSSIKTGCFEEQKFMQAVQESSEIIAFNVATKYISSKLKTEQQIKDYLYKKEYHKQTVDAVIEKFLKGNSNYKVEEISSPLNNMPTRFGIQFLPDISFGAGFYICKMRKL